MWSGSALGRRLRRGGCGPRRVARSAAAAGLPAAGGRGGDPGPLPARRPLPSAGAGAAGPRATADGRLADAAGAAANGARRALPGVVRGLRPAAEPQRPLWSLGPARLRPDAPRGRGPHGRLVARPPPPLLPEHRRLAAGARPGGARLPRPPGQADRARALPAAGLV